MSEENELDSPAFDALALGVEPITPPPGLRERILAAAAQGGEVVPLRAPRPRRGWPRVPLAAVAASLVVALAAGLLAGSAIGRNGTPPASPQVVHFNLQGHGSLSGVSATVTDLKSDGIALVSFTGLPAPPDGKVYELWLITASNQADASGVFLPDSNGQRVLVIERPLSGFKVIAVTVETGPDGVQSPTQQPQIYGTIA